MRLQLFYLAAVHLFPGNAVIYQGLVLRREKRIANGGELIRAGFKELVAVALKYFVLGSGSTFALERIPQAENIVAQHTGESTFRIIFFKEIIFQCTRYRIPRLYEIQEEAVAARYLLITIDAGGGLGGIGGVYTNTVAVIRCFTGLVAGAEARGGDGRQ